MSQTDRTSNSKLQTRTPNAFGAEKFQASNPKALEQRQTSRMPLLHGNEAHSGHRGIDACCLKLFWNLKFEVWSLVLGVWCFISTGFALQPSPSKVELPGLRPDG